MRCVPILACSFVSSVCCALAGGVFTFAIAASIDQEHGMSCHVAGEPECDDMSDDINWVLNMTIGGAAAGFSIPLFLTFCCIAEECKNRARDEGMSCSQYIASRMFGFFSSIKNTFKSSYTNIRDDSLENDIERLKI